MALMLEGKIALVTGCAGGIGRAALLGFAREGAVVVGVDVDGQRGEESAAMARANGGRAQFMRVDVTKAAEVESLIKRVVEAHGRLDCAFNNAGVEGAVVTTTECTEAEFDRIMSVNVRGVWLCMKYELLQMVRQGAGAIVNTSSVAGLVGFVGLPVYTASKHAVIGLTKAAALEFAKSGVRVNAICPGPIDTAMMERIESAEGMPGREQYEAFVPMTRYGDPKEPAAAALWLCSDAASFVTGTALPADGGLLAQ